MVFAFLIGIIAGLRSLTAPAVVSWAAHLGWINLPFTWLSFLSHPVTVGIFTALALVELVTDKLPKTPSRKTPGPFAFRIIFGALSGVALAGVAGGVLGGIGGVAGTLGGYAARTGLVKAFKSPDWVVAICEDMIAVCGGLLLVSRF